MKSKTISEDELLTPPLVGGRTPVQYAKKKPDEPKSAVVADPVVSKATTIPTIGGKPSHHHPHHIHGHHISGGTKQVVVVGGSSSSTSRGVPGLPIRNIAVHATRVATQSLSSKSQDDAPGRREKSTYSHRSAHGRTGVSSHQDRSGTPTIDERNLSSEPPQGYQIQALPHQPPMVMPMTHPPPYTTGNSYMYQPPSYHIPPPRDIVAYPPGVDDPRHHQFRGAHHQHHYQPPSTRPRPRLPPMYRGQSPINGSIPSGPVEDPLTMFENLMNDKKARRLRMRRMRSRSPSRSYSRSLSRSPGSRSPRSRTRSPRSRTRSPNSRARSRSPRSRSPPHKRRLPLTSAASRSRTRSRSNSLSRSPSRSQRSRSGSRSSVSRDRKFSPMRREPRRRLDSRDKSPPHQQLPTYPHVRSHNSPMRSTPPRYYSHKYLKEESRTSQGGSGYRQGGPPDRRGRSARQDYYSSSSTSKAEYTRYNDRYDSRHSTRERSYKRYDEYTDEYSEMAAKDWERIRDREIEQREREKQYEYYSLGGGGGGSVGGSSRDRRSDSPPRDRHKRRGQDSATSSSTKHHHHHSQPPPASAAPTSVPAQSVTEAADTKEPSSTLVAPSLPTNQEDSSRVLVDLKREPSREKTKTPDEKDKKTKEKKKKKKEDTEKKRKKKDKKVKDKKDTLPDSTQPTDVEVAQKEAESKTSEDTLKKDDLYGGLEANIDQNVVENYSKIADEQPSPNKDVMLAPVPELSKWEKDDETPGGGSALEVKVEEKAQPLLADEAKQVTSEVLKRAENAIFKKAVNPLKTVEPKKSTSTLEPPVKKKEERHAPKSVALPVRPPQPPLQGQDDRRRHQKPSPVRISAKERLGAKIEDKIIVKHSIKLSKREIKIEKMPPKSVVRKERSDSGRSESSRKSSREDPKKYDSKKRVPLDESSFEPDYETSDHEPHHHHSDRKPKKRSPSTSRMGEKPPQPSKKPKTHEEEDHAPPLLNLVVKPVPVMPVVVPVPHPAQEHSDEESSGGGSSDDSDHKHKRSRKKSKKRKRSKKHCKRKHDSTSDSESSSSSSGSESERRKRRHKHKSHKKSKKRKKSKK